MYAWSTHDHMAYILRIEDVMAVDTSKETAQGRAKMQFGCSNGFVATKRCKK